jgi:small-conductance mechanosensitive channel
LLVTQWIDAAQAAASSLAGVLAAIPAAAALGSLVLGMAGWKLIDLATRRYETRQPMVRGVDRDGRAVVPLVRLTLRFTLVLCVATAVVSNLAVNVRFPLAIVGVPSIAVTVASQDTLADVIDGALIQLDRPFRVGDRIQLQELQTWGDVVAIGVRTTRIRTLDNRLVIVPNSRIGRGQIVNYSYSDDTYRLEVYIGVAYGTDVDLVRRLIVASVRDVDLILQDRPVDALVDTLDDSALRFRVRCWIESYADYRKARDRVQTSLYRALQSAAIESPINTISVRLSGSEPVLERGSMRSAA